MVSFRTNGNNQQNDDHHIDQFEISNKILIGVSENDQNLYKRAKYYYQGSYLGIYLLLSQQLFDSLNMSLVSILRDLQDFSPWCLLLVLLQFLLLS